MLAWTVFEWRILHSLGTSIVGYLLLRFWPRASVGKAICALSFSYLLLCHIYREFYVSNVAFDCPQMILTFKLTALGINWSDGAANTITAKNNPSKLKQLPSILQYMGQLMPTIRSIWLMCIRISILLSHLFCWPCVRVPELSRVDEGMLHGNR